MVIEWAQGHSNSNFGPCNRSSPCQNPLGTFHSPIFFVSRTRWPTTSPNVVDLLFRMSSVTHLLSQILLTALGVSFSKTQSRPLCSSSDHLPCIWSVVSFRFFQYLFCFFSMVSGLPVYSCQLFLPAIFCIRQFVLKWECLQHLCLYLLGTSSFL